MKPFDFRSRNVIRGTRLFLALAVVCTWWYGSSYAQETDLRGTQAARIEAYVKPFVETNNLSGVVCITRGDSVLFQRGFGTANHEFNIANAPETRFHIASVSKPFTAAAILLLEEQGLLRTEEPVSKILHEYPRGEEILLDHLLKHSSGIPNVNNFPEYDSVSRFPHSTQEIVAMFRERPLEFEPGSRVRYSNSNYNLLALIIEKVSGQSYGDFLRTNIFDRLELPSMLHDGDATAVIPHRASGTVPDGIRGVKLVPYLDWSIKTGNGSLVATARDLCRFARSLFAGKLLRPSSLAKLTQPGASLPYGWAKDERFDRRIVRANGRSPGFVTSLEYFPDDSLCIAILTNSYSSSGVSIAADLSALTFGHQPAVPSVAYIPPRVGELAAFSGKYQMPDHYYVPGAILFLKDRGDFLEANWSNGASTIIYPAGGDNFVDRTYWARIRFTRDASGQISGFVYDLLQEFNALKILP